MDKWIEIWKYTCTLLSYKLLSTEYAPSACSNAALLQGPPRGGALLLWKGRQSGAAKAWKSTLFLVRPRPAAPSLRQHRRQTPPAAGLPEIRTRSSRAGTQQVATQGALELPRAATGTGSQARTATAGT